MKKIAVILSGCGVFDGSEVHEAVLTMLAITKLGAEYQCFAPNIEVQNPINHHLQDASTIPYNVIEMSGRIARGKILPVTELNISEYDGIVFPGGMGAVKSLCNFASKGIDCDVNPEVEQLIKTCHSQGKVIGALCIAPVLIARVLSGVTLTIGNDEGTAGAIEQMGCNHVVCGSYETCVDNENNIVSSPAYMLAGSIAEVEQSAFNTIKNMLEIM